MSAAARPIMSAPPASPALRSIEALWLARTAEAGARAADDPLEALRSQAMHRVMALGLPGSRDDTWRYTNLRSVLARTFVHVPDGQAPGAEDADADAVDSLVGPAARAATVLVVNGRPILSPPDGNGNNLLQISRLSDLSRPDIEKIQGQLGLPSDAEEARWALLNAALFADGLHVRISGALDEPLVIRHLLRSEFPNGLVHPRVLIELTSGASATVIEHYVDRGRHPPLGNSVTQLVLGHHSRLEHYRVFSTSAAAEHIDSLTVRQAGHSHCRQFTAVLGGGLVRTALHAHLSAAGAELDCHALLVGHEARQVDCVNIVAHDARDTRSRQTARAIASGTSRAAFNTKVVVNRGAVHAESEQSFRGLILSPSAEIDSRPQLEIHADEVKCAHGSTTGRLNPDMLFYLLSRGLDRRTAQTLLVYAFLADVLTGMSVACARAAIETALVPQLPDSKILEEFR